MAKRFLLGVRAFVVASARAHIRGKIQNGWIIAFFDKLPSDIDAVCVHAGKRGFAGIFRLDAEFFAINLGSV